MRLLSKILKHKKFQISNPRIIKFDNCNPDVLQETYEETAVQNDILVQFALQVAQEKENLENLKSESEKVITETEGLVNEILEKARGEARSIISLAKEDAEQIVLQAEQEAQKLLQEGYEEGLRKAQEEVKDDQQKAIEQSKEILEEARRSKLEIISSAEEEIISLVIAITRKVIASELQMRPELIKNIVKEAVEILDSPENVKVSVNPEDIELLTEKLCSAELFEIGNKRMEISLKPDNRISRGGCIVESNSAIVDATMETRIQNIDNALKEVAVVG